MADQCSAVPCLLPLVLGKQSWRPLMKVQPADALVLLFPPQVLNENEVLKAIRGVLAKRRRGEQLVVLDRATVSGTGSWCVVGALAATT